MPNPVFQLIFEGAVLLVDIKVVLFIRVVGNIHIRPAVAIDVRDEGAETKADEAAVYAGLLCDLGEVAVVIAEEVIASAFEPGLYGPFGIGKITAIGIVQGIDRDGAVVDHKTIEVAVAVIVKKSDLGSVGGYAEPVFVGGFGKGEVMIVDIELVLAVAIAHMPGVADIDVEPSVIVDIHEHYACAPHAVLSEAGLVGDVLELEIAFVEIKLIVRHVGGEEDVGEAVVVDIPDGDATAVVEIAEKEAIIEPTIFYVVLKMDACIFFQLEQGRGVGGVITGGEKKYSQQAGK